MINLKIVCLKLHVLIMHVTVNAMQKCFFFPIVLFFGNYDNII